MQKKVLWFGLLMLAISTAAAAQELPPIAKDTMRVKADYTHHDPIQWRPIVEFWFMGELPSGSTVAAEFGYAGKKSWAKMDCEADWNDFDKATKTHCSNREIVPTSYAGLVDVSIIVRNDLHGTNAVAYKGKFKVIKHMRAGRYLEFYVDEDWRLPIGYLYQDNRGGGLMLGSWIKGSPGSLRMFLFHNGKEIAKNERCGFEDRDFAPKEMKWFENECLFGGIYANAEQARKGYEPNYDLSANPGEYEIKILSAGKLGATVKFTVTAEGKIDDSISVNNQLARDRVIVPINILDERIPYDKAAWKTGAFYGNPLTGFSVPASGPVATK